MPVNKTVQSFTPPQSTIKSRTITKDLTISLVVIVITVSMIAIASHYFYVCLTEERRLEQIADEYQSYLIESLELPIWTLDRKISAKIAESYFNNDLVEMIQINENFYDSNRTSSAKTIFKKSKSSESDLVVREFEIYHNGRSIGNVKFGLTRRFYQENLKQLLVSNFIILLLIILSLVFLTAVLIRLLINRPLNSLVQGINQISRGNYEYDFKKFKQIEIQSIISDFKYMADQVRGREESFADINRQLGFEVRARKKIESAIRNSEAQLRATFESSSDGILVTDNNGHVINANDRFYQMWKMPKSVRYKDTDHVLTDFMVDQLKNPDTISLKNSKNSIETFAELYLKDGRIFERVSRSLIYSGNDFGLVMNFRDVTDLKKSIIALRESENRFRQLSEAALEAIVIHDNGIILQVNDQFLKMFDYNRKDIVGKLSFVRIISSEFREMFEPEIILRQKTFLEILGLRHEGIAFPIIIQTKEIIYYGKNVLVSVIRDVSDMKAAEAETQTLRERLARSEKMEAIGLLAGGVAHDLNNILSGIVSYPELLLMRKGLDEKTRKALKIIQSSGERAAAVVNDLTTISRGIASNKEILSLNSIVKEYLISPEFYKLNFQDAKIQLKVDVASDLSNIEASRLHIRKSIMNLVTNASEAIEPSGQIIISTKNCYLDRPLKDYNQVNAGEYVVLSISDTGSGISEEEINRIFEPFYTKKVMGRSGTGLGLTVVWNTVQDHNGYVVVSSNNKMTRFDMYFPITEGHIKEQQKKISIDKYYGNNENILVVDDEKNQRDIACEMLKTLGYKTVEVQSGEAAVEQVRKNAFDLILLDMIMPTGMNGHETYKQIIKYFPGQKAIIASGFSVNMDVKTAQKLGAGQFIKKPYTIEELGLAIQRELSGKKTHRN
ncbi:MAG: PAS domain S-box protein [Desulfobacteraceae bacterium]|jgi:two-component system cell cycle sensor histidine kinase/response regulator CckA|nr:PAS domain S-box protein [Desulfobacteraceae bacterium]